MEATLMQLTKEEYNFLLEWIQCNFIPRKTTNRDICAYTIHGIFERIYDKGFYVDETTVAKALIGCGYSPLYQDGQIYFNISNKSRAVQIYYVYLGDPSKARSFQWL